MKRIFGNRNNSLRNELVDEEAPEEDELPTPPGSTGYFLIWDHALSFYRRPVKFLMDMQKFYGSPIFVCRFLKQRTVFLCNHKLVTQLLMDETESAVPGYGMFLEHIYGSNILFRDGLPAKELREALMKVFSERAVYDYHRCIGRVLDRNFQQLVEMTATGRKIAMYNFFKKVATETCLSIFLGLDFDKSKEFAETIVKLTITHWHGIISVPVNVKVPGIARTNYAKAQEAKNELLAIIRELRSSTRDTWLFCKHMRNCWKDLNGKPPKDPEETRPWEAGDKVPPRYDEDELDRHFLLFTSALVPKALASILIWTMVELGRNKSWQEEARRDEQFREFILLEVQRCYPPFFAGYRITKQAMVFNGFHVAAGTSIVYVTYSAHRDQEIYPNPDSFFPQRWKYCAAEMRELFAFGGGSRSCIGQNLAWAIINEVLNRLFQKFSWTLVEKDSNVEPKWLPVSRPKGCALFTLSVLTEAESEVDVDDLEEMVDHTLRLANSEEHTEESLRVPLLGPLVLTHRLPSVSPHLRPPMEMECVADDSRELLSERSVTTVENARGRSIEPTALGAALRTRSHSPARTARADGVPRIEMARAHSYGPELRLRRSPLPTPFDKCPCKHSQLYSHPRHAPLRAHPTPLHHLGPAAYKKYMLHGGHFVTDHADVHDKRIPCMPASEGQLGTEVFSRRSPLPVQPGLSWLVHHPVPPADQLNLLSSEKASSQSKLLGPSEVRLVRPSSSKKEF